MIRRSPKAFLLFSLSIVIALVISTILFNGQSIVSASAPTSSPNAAPSTPSPPSTTGQPSTQIISLENLIIIIASALSAIVAIVALVKGLPPYIKKRKMKQREKELLEEIEKTASTEQLVTLRKKIVHENINNSITLEGFNVLNVRIDHAMQELRDDSQTKKDQ